MSGRGGGLLDPGAVRHGEALHQVVQGQPPGVPAGAPGQLAAGRRHIGDNQAVLEQKALALVIGCIFSKKMVIIFFCLRELQGWIF